MLTINSPLNKNGASFNSATSRIGKRNNGTINKSNSNGKMNASPTISCIIFLYVRCICITSLYISQKRRNQSTKLLKSNIFHTVKKSKYTSKYVMKYDKKRDIKGNTLQHETLPKGIFICLMRRHITVYRFCRHA